MHGLFGYSIDAAAAGIISFLAVGACIYSNPYSLHQVSSVGYEQFDSPPLPSGTVLVDGKQFDFRVPKSSLTSERVAQVQSLVGQSRDTRTAVTALVEYVRAHLNAADKTLPPANSTVAEDLLVRGRSIHCLCSEHALVLNELLQACGIHSRVLWLEGHVINDYYDPDQQKWLLVDSHMNVMAEGPQGELLSAAETIRAMERDVAIRFVRVVNQSNGSHNLSYDHSQREQRLWYRNVLLNGDCYAQSGTTLQCPSRWSHLARFHAVPQMLVLTTDFNTSHAKYIEPFSIRKSGLITAMFLVVYFGLKQTWRLSPDGVGERQRAPGGWFAARRKPAPHTSPSGMFPKISLH